MFEKCHENLKHHGISIGSQYSGDDNCSILHYSEEGKSIRYVNFCWIVIQDNIVCNFYDDHLSGKPGNIREFDNDSCQGNVRDFNKNQGNVRDKSLLGKLA